MITPELKVSSFARSLDFYTKTLGFVVSYERPEEEFAMLSVNGAPFMIEGLSEKSRTMKVGVLEQPFGRGMHLQIEVQDVDALHARVQKAGHPIFSEMEEKWYRTNDGEAGNRQFWIQDPDGYLLRFFSDLGTRAI